MNRRAGALHPAADAARLAGAGRTVGGIDFGFRNPFAAVWGNLDRDGVLFLTGEHYASKKPLSQHMRYLPRDVVWYADPSGANEIAELKVNNFKVNPGINKLQHGIGAVTARIEDGSLQILEGRCPNLLREAALYRYDDAGDSETPLDDSNHALGALRYLISRLDERRRERQPAPPPPVFKDADGNVITAEQAEENRRWWQKWFGDVG